MFATYTKEATDIAYVVCFDVKTFDYVLMNRWYQYLIDGYPYTHETYDKWKRLFIFVDTVEDKGNPLYRYETGVNIERYTERFSGLVQKYKLRNYVGGLTPLHIKVSVSATKE